MLTRETMHQKKENHQSLQSFPQCSIIILIYHQLKSNSLISLSVLQFTSIQNYFYSHRGRGGGKITSLAQLILPIWERGRGGGGGAGTSEVVINTFIYAITWQMAV